MWHLMKSELLRFRTFLIAFAIVHLLALKLVSMWVGLFAQDAAKTSLGLLIYALSGLIFGLYQMGSYKKPNRWTYLIHRPLLPGRIFAALCAAAAAFFAAVVAAPLLLMTLYTDFLSAEWVDARHYLLVPFLYGLVAVFYLIGCLIALSASRAAFLVLLLPTFFLTFEAVGAWIFLPLAFVLAWLAFLGWAAFKPDLTTHVRRPLPAAAMSVAIAYGMLGILWFASNLTYSTIVAFKEEGWRSYAAFAWNDYFPEGTIHAVDYMNDIDVMRHGLVDDSKRVRQLEKQIALAELFELPGPRFARWPVRHQPMFVDKWLIIEDRENNIYWKFSHDRMLFHGREMRSGQSVGWLGTTGPTTMDDDGQRFPDIPYIRGKYIVTRQHIYEYDARRKRVDLRFALSDDEIWSTPFTHHSTFVVAKSDRRLFFFEPRDFKNQPGRVEPTSTVALPGDVNNISRIHVAELIDSYLISFLLGSRSERGFAEARQVMAEVGIDGSYEVVAERLLEQGPPTIMRHNLFIFSPLLQYGHDLAWAAIGPFREECVTAGDIVRHPPPASMILTALALAVLAAVVTAWSARRRALSAARVKAWTAGAFLLGWPGFLAFLFLTSRDEWRAVPESERAPLLSMGALVNQESWS